MLILATSNHPGRKFTFTVITEIKKKIFHLPHGALSSCHSQIYVYTRRSAQQNYDVAGNLVR